MLRYVGVWLVFFFVVLGVAHAESKILLVFAHPDDETLMGSTLIKLLDQKANVKALYATEGEGGRVFIAMKNGQPTFKSLSPVEMKKIRTAELAKALPMFGVTLFDFFFFPDEPFRDEKGTVSKKLDEFLKRGIWNEKKLLKRIEEEIQSFNPHTVITLSLDENIHAHHKAVRWATQKVIESKKFPSLQCFLGLRENYWVNDHQTTENYPSLKVDTTSYQGRAFKAAQNHASQMVGHIKPKLKFEEFYLISSRPNCAL